MSSLWTLIRTWRQIGTWRQIRFAHRLQAQFYFHCAFDGLVAFAVWHLLLGHTARVCLSVGLSVCPRLVSLSLICLVIPVALNLKLVWLERNWRRKHWQCMLWALKNVCFLSRTLHVDSQGRHPESDFMKYEPVFYFFCSWTESRVSWGFLYVIRKW